MDAGTTYRITVEGRLGTRWAPWFDGLTVADAAGVTTLTGSIRDQAALHGLLERIRDLGLVLLRVEVLDDREASS